MGSETPKLPQGGSELARDKRPCPRVGYAALRRYRWSSPRLTYFVTFCTEGRKEGLHELPMLDALDRESAAIEMSEIWRMRARVTMPEHVHLLFELGESRSLGQAIARLKAKTAPALRAAGLRWQSGYFERRLREADSVLPIIHYLLMNPVRAQLIEKGEDWPGFHCNAEDWRWYSEYSPGTVAEPDWLVAAEGVAPREVASKLAPTLRT